MDERSDVVVVGAGSAGLAVSHELASAGVAHVVLERGRTGQTWRDRWDSFCLVTPNWTVRLPGGEYDGPNPDGYMSRAELVAHMERYAAKFGSPVREGIEVRGLETASQGGFRLRTSAGEVHAAAVVLATGAYQRPHRPGAAETLPPGLPQLDAEAYTNPSALPSGAVLVVGSGQTGCQLAEEIHESGRDVFLACGRAPWAPRRFEGRDLIAWMAGTPFFEATLAELPTPQARLVANVQATGHGGGHDLHYRVLQAMGVNLLGHFRGAEGRRASFASDMAESVAFGDARYNDLRALITATCATAGAPPPEMPDPAPFRADARDSLDLTGFGAVIFTSGFRPDYRRWVGFPDAFDDLGFPIQLDGASTVVDGLYFVGVHFLRKRKSSLLYGVGEDATIVAQGIAKRLSASPGVSRATRR
jgi:putative flavoprotein involved in K+ transport